MQVITSLTIKWRRDKVYNAGFIFISLTMNSKISLIIWFKKYCGILACVHILGYRIQDTEYRIQDAGFRIQNTEYRIQDTG